jgi:hypothetical protein
MAQIGRDTHPSLILQKWGLLVYSPKNVKTGLKMVASDKHASLFCLSVNDGEKSFITLAGGVSFSN